MPDPTIPAGAPSLIRPMFRTLGIAASGLSAQRARMETIATNIANAETTRTEGGGPYRRRVVEMQAVQSQFTDALATASGASSPADATAAATAPAAGATGAAGAAGAAGAVDLTAGSQLATGEAPAGDAKTDPMTDRAGGVKVTGITEDPSEGPLVYDPSHPDANADGYVRYPNVRVTDELVDLMDARRMYEANATVFQVTKAMLRRSIDI